MDIEFEKDLDRLLKIAIEAGNSLQGQKIDDKTNMLFYSEGLGQKIIHL